MRQDQFDKLQALEERLTDVFLVEAEPDKWPGHGIEAAQMDKATRGDRYWVKKNAVATLSLIQRVGSLVHQIQVGGAGPSAEPPPGADGEQDELDNEIESAEKEAAQLMARLHGAGKAEFDRRAHGKT